MSERQPRPRGKRLPDWRRFTTCGICATPLVSGTNAKAGEDSYAVDHRAGEQFYAEARKAGWISASRYDPQPGVSPAYQFSETLICSQCARLWLGDSGGEGAEA